MSSSASSRFSPYDDTDLMLRHVAEGKHRAVIGGLWEEMGALQLAFLTAHGLHPAHRLIDVGAGSFRGGLKIIPYLSAGNYYAIDIQESLMDAGYTHEIEPAGLAGRFPRAQYAANAAFDVSSFGVMFDMGIAQSVFTHMPLARLADCLVALAPHFRSEGRFFTTVFLAREQDAHGPVRHRLGQVVTTPTHDPFHTTITALHKLATETESWRMEIIGDWAHPRDQQMVAWTRES